MRLKISVLILLLLLTPGALLAEESPGEITQEIPAPSNLELKFYFPETLSGTNLTLMDSAGTVIGESAIDETGQGILTVPASPESFSLRAATGEIISNEEENHELTALEILPGIIIAFIVTAALFFLLGRLTLIKVLKGLKEVVYDEKID